MMLVTNGIDSFETLYRKYIYKFMNGIDSFETLYRKYIYKFMKRVEYSSNVIIDRMYGNY